MEAAEEVSRRLWPKKCWPIRSEEYHKHRQRLDQPCVSVFRSSHSCERDISRTPWENFFKFCSTRGQGWWFAELIRFWWPQITGWGQRSKWLDGIPFLWRQYLYNNLREFPQICNRHPLELKLVKGRMLRLVKMLVLTIFHNICYERRASKLKPYIKMRHQGVLKGIFPQIGNKLLIKLWKDSKFYSVVSKWFQSVQTESLTKKKSQENISCYKQSAFFPS